MQVGSSEQAQLQPGDDDKQEEVTITRLLVTCYVFDRFVVVIFEFVLVVFLSSIFPDSLWLVSIYGLNSGLLVFCLGGKTGQFFDTGVANNRRLQSTLLVLTGQYICVVGCCVMCSILLSISDDLGHSSKVILFLIIVLSGCGQVLSEAVAVSVENDWIVAISDNRADFMRIINVKLRRVHLISRMLGPIAASQCLKGLDSQSKFILIGIVSVILSFLIKYKCLERICSIVPALVMLRGDDTFMEEEALPQEQHHRSSCSFIGSYATYFSQDIALGGLGESLLYLNGMTSGDIMTSYLIWRRLSLNWIGIVRGASAITGLLGTIVFDWSFSRYPLRTTATASIAFMVTCLSVSVCGTVFVSNDKVSLCTLVVGVIISRIGLWANDLSIFQLTQLTVSENERGIVGGSQHSLNAFFSALHFTSGLIWADPSQFYILCLIGYSAVVASFSLMLRGVYFSNAFRDVPKSK